MPRVAKSDKILAVHSPQIRHHTYGRGDADDEGNDGLYDECPQGAGVKQP